MASSNTTSINHYFGKNLTTTNSSQLPVNLSPPIYPTWRLQITFMRGFNLHGYVDGTLKSPATTITQNGREVTNLEYELWY